MMKQDLTSHTKKRHLNAARSKALLREFDLRLLWLGFSMAILIAAQVWLPSAFADPVSDAAAADVSVKESQSPTLLIPVASPPGLPSAGAAVQSPAAQDSPVAVTTKTESTVSKDSPTQESVEKKVSQVKGPDKNTDKKIASEKKSVKKLKYGDHMQAGRKALALGKTAARKGNKKTAHNHFQKAKHHYHEAAIRAKKVLVKSKALIEDPDVEDKSTPGAKFYKAQKSLAKARAGYHVAGTAADHVISSDRKVASE